MLLRQFPSPDAQAKALVLWVVERLQKVLAERDQAVLVVPGGSTPQRFLAQFALESLDWSRIVIGLTDERCVPVASARRNESMLRQNLPQARVLSLLDAAGVLTEAAVPVADVVVLGMGDDGHVASLFPGSVVLLAAAQASSATILPVDDAPGGEQRVSRSYAGLKGRYGTALLIAGDMKRQLILGPAAQDLPIAACLDEDLMVFWAPE